MANSATVDLSDLGFTPAPKAAGSVDLSSLGFVPEKAPVHAVNAQNAELKAYEPSVATRIIDALNDSDISTQIFGPSTNTLLRQGQNRVYFDDQGNIQHSDRLQSPEERGAIPAVGAAIRQPLATATRIIPGILATEGGPAGAAINASGEVVGQLIDPRPRMSPDAVLAQPEKPLLDRSRIAEAGVFGSIPLGSTKGILNTVKNAVKIGAGGAAAEEARSLVAGEKPSVEGGKQAVEQGGLMTAISLAVPVVAKLLGIATRNVTPEVMAEVQKAIRDNAETASSIEKMTSKGAVINPASQNPSLLNKGLGSMAGLQNIKNKAIAINAPVLDDVARAEAGLLPHEVINADTLEVARSRIAAPLNELRGLGLQKEVDGWEKANQARQDLLDDKANGLITNGQLRDGLVDVQAAMRSFEQTIDTAAAKANKPELVGVLPQIQERFAKNYDVRRITPSGTGHVNADIASNLEAQRKETPSKMTGGLREIAEFNNAAYDAAGNVNAIAPHSGTLAPHAALGALAVGTGGKAALSGGLMGLRGPIADLLLSPEYQRGEGILGALSGGAKRKYPLAKNLSEKDIKSALRAAGILATDEIPDKN